MVVSTQPTTRAAPAAAPASEVSVCRSTAAPRSEKDTAPNARSPTAIRVVPTMRVTVVADGVRRIRATASQTPIRSPNRWPNVDK